MFTLKVITEICPNCGMINSLKYVKSTYEDMGTKDKYRTVGWYYEKVTTTGTVKNPEQFPGDYHEVEFTTKKYVPKTEVYQGKYKQTRENCVFTCVVCGGNTTKSYENETKMEE